MNISKQCVSLLLLFAFAFILLFSPSFPFTLSNLGYSQFQPNDNGVSTSEQIQLSNNDNNIELLSTSTYNDNLDYLHIIGEVQNNSPNPQKSVKEVVSFYDSAHNVIGTSFAYTNLEVLRPGEKSPFEAILNNVEQARKTEEYSISPISGEKTEPKSAYLKLSIDDNYYDTLGYAHVVGKVTNSGPGITTGVKVSGTFYNDENEIIGTSFTLTEPAYLGPGQSAPFDLTVTEYADATATGSNPGKISSGSLNIQSSEYAMILPAAIFVMDSRVVGEEESSSSSRSGSGNGNDDDDDDDDNRNDDNNSNKNKELEIDIDIAKDPIIRGHKQTITVTVSDTDSDIEDARIKGSVKYASGKHTEKLDPDTTDSSGKASFSWRIGGNSNPGTFTAIIEASKDGYDSASEKASFKVTSKEDEEIECEDRSAEECEDRKSKSKSKSDNDKDDDENKIAEEKRGKGTAKDGSYDINNCTGKDCEDADRETKQEQESDDCYPKKTELC